MNMEKKNSIEIIGLQKSFEQNKMVLKDINLIIPKNEITCIIGQSGEGKSVLLKHIIGLLQPNKGEIIINGVDIVAASDEVKQDVLSHFGYVFQFAALLDSLTIFENIGIVELENNMNQEQVKELVIEKLRLVNLDETVLYKYPSEISGGMKKRVGLARTLMRNPSVILYDEPTTGLDPITTKIIHELIFEMQHKLNVTSIVISHDIEIFNYVDTVSLLYNGEIVTSVSAKTIWENKNPYIYQFIRGLHEGPIQKEEILQKV